MKECRRQQENTLSEMLQEKADVAKWAAEERRKTEEFCEDQRQAALRERRALAKQAREAREKENVSLRKDRAEVEGLNATIEKLKIDLEKLSKKAKANEKRLSHVILTSLSYYKFC